MSKALERLRRAELAKLRMDEIVDEARRCRDPQRLAVLEDESHVIVQSLREIRREQLTDDLERLQKPDGPFVTGFKTGWRKWWPF